MNHNELPCLDLFFLSLLMNQNYIPYIVLAVLDSVYIYDHKKKLQQEIKGLKKENVLQSMSIICLYNYLALTAFININM